MVIRNHNTIVLTCNMKINAYFQHHQGRLEHCANTKFTSICVNTAQREYSKYMPPPPPLPLPPKKNTFEGKCCFVSTIMIIKIIKEVIFLIAKTHKNHLTLQNFNWSKRKSLKLHYNATIFFLSKMCSRCVRLYSLCAGVTQIHIKLAYFTMIDI